MMPVVGGPPEGAALECAIAYQGKDELRSSRSRKGAMGKIAMIKPRDGKHAHGVCCQSYPHGYGAPTNPENGETGQVQQAEGNDANPFAAPLRKEFFAMGCFGIKPAQEAV